MFVVVRRKLPDFDGRNLRGWLYRIAQRTVRDYRRRAWFRRVFLGDGRIFDEAAADSFGHYDPAHQFELKEAEGKLRHLLSHMSVVRRTAFILYEVEGYSGEEIAALEGIPLNTVWTRLYHARKDFLRLMKEDQAGGAP